MNFQVNGSDDLAQAQRDLQALASEMPHVAVRAMNKAMIGTKTDMKNVIRAEYNIKAGEINKRLSVRKANRAQIQGHVQSKGGPVSLTDVAASPDEAAVFAEITLDNSVLEVQQEWEFSRDVLSWYAWLTIGFAPISDVGMVKIEPE